MKGEVGLKDLLDKRMFVVVFFTPILIGCQPNSGIWQHVESTLARPASDWQAQDATFSPSSTTKSCGCSFVCSPVDFWQKSTGIKTFLERKSFQCDQEQMNVVVQFYAKAGPAGIFFNQMIVIKFSFFLRSCLVFRSSIRPSWALKW